MPLAARYYRGLGIKLSSMLLIFSLTLAFPLTLAAQAETPAAGARPASNSVLHDAPYRVIPGNPLLTAEGETLAELGFAAADELIAAIGKPMRAYATAFSPLTGFAATGSGDGSVRLWDWQSGALLHQFAAHSNRVASVAFSPDGRLLASGSYDHSIKLWDVPTRTLLHTFNGHSNWVRSVAFGPKGRFLASGSDDKTLKLWDLQHYGLHHSFNGHSEGVGAVTFDTSGALLASGSYDQTVKLWDVQIQTQIASFEGHTRSINTVAFSPNGDSLASGSDDNTIKLWDVPAKRLSHTFTGHSNAVNTVAFSVDGRFLASGSGSVSVSVLGPVDYSVKLWDVQNQRLLDTFAGHSAPVKTVSFVNGHFLASASVDQIQLGDIPSHSLRQSFGGKQATIESVAADPSGHFYAWGAYDGSVKLWDRQSNTLAATFSGHLDDANAVSFSPDGRLLASGSDDGIVRLWDTDTRQLLAAFTPRATSANNSRLEIRIRAIAFSPDARLLAIGMYGKVQLWDVAKQTLLHVFKSGSGFVTSVAFSPNGQWLAFGSGFGNQTVKLWDMATLKLVHSFEVDPAPITSVAFSPDGRYLAAGDTDNHIILWQLKDKKRLHSFASRTFTEVFNTMPIAFSPDSRFIASGSLDGFVELWDIDNKTLLHDFQAHSEAINSVAFAPDGTLVTGSNDGLVKRWELKTFKALDTIMADENGNWLRIDPQQRVFRGDDGTLFNQRSPLPPVDSSKPAHLAMVISPLSLTISPGESQEIAITVSNTGLSPAYWLHLKPSNSADEAVRLNPAINSFEHLLTGKGQQLWQPTRIAKLAAGESATLYARINPNLTFPARFITPGEHSIVLTLISANGSEVSQTIQVTVQSPQLQWQSAQWDSEGEILKIGLENTGSLPLRNFTLNLNAPGLAPLSQQTLSQQTIALLAAGGKTEIAVTLPQSLDLDTQPLILNGHTAGLPIFSWALSAPEIVGTRASRISLWLLAVLLLLTLLAVFYLRRYRHPLVLQLSADPALLLQLPPTQLGQARTRLTQTQRLDTVLSHNHLSSKTLDEAIAFFDPALNQDKSKDQQRLTLLAKRLGADVKVKVKVKVKGKGMTQTAANSQDEIMLWELHLPDEFPLNVSHFLIAFAPPDSQPGVFLNALNKITKTRFQITCLIAPATAKTGDQQLYQQQLYQKTGDKSNKLVAPSPTGLTRLLLDPAPQTVLAGIMAEQLALTQLSPYQLGGGVKREAIFFGRDEIIAHIMNREAANYLLVSGRQLGKSSILKALERRYQNHPELNCHYIALNNEILLPRLASRLKLPKEAQATATADMIAETIAERVAQGQGRFLFLIDEADKFVRHELKTDYRILDSLRRMSEEGHCQFIIAGFWALYEQAVLNYQSPLKNFAEIIQLGELEPEACRDLATQPMQTMNLSYATPALVGELLQQTGRRANLMTIACHQLLTILQPNQRVIEMNDVQQALHSSKMLDALKGWDAMTDDSNACLLDRIVVFATITETHFDLSWLVDKLKRLGLQPDDQQLDHSLARLTLGFILGRTSALAQQPGGDYFYRVPLFRKLILEDAPEVKLQMALGQWQG